MDANSQHLKTHAFDYRYFSSFSDDLVVTGGASPGLAMLSSLYFSPGDMVFVEDPTYFVAQHTLQDDCGLVCVPCKQFYSTKITT